MILDKVIDLFDFFDNVHNIEINNIIMEADDQVLYKYLFFSQCTNSHLAIYFTNNVKFEM